MAAQPIYRDEFNRETERLFIRLTKYIDTRLEPIASEIRLNREEMIARLITIEAVQQEILTFQRTMAEAFTAFGKDVHAQLAEMRGAIGELRQEMRGAIGELRQEMTDLRAEMRDGFAAQAERHNELMQRVVRLEGNQKPPET